MAIRSKTTTIPASKYHHQATPFFKSIGEVSPISTSPAWGLLFGLRQWLYKLVLLSAMLRPLACQQKDYRKKGYYFGAGFLVNFPKTGQDTFASCIIKSVRQRNHSFPSLVGWFSGFASREDGGIGR